MAPGRWRKPLCTATCANACSGGAGWRLAELQSGATFTITQADCTHTGNRDIGRDRVIVTWQTPDGHTESDHLDLRYCE